MCVCVFKYSKTGNSDHCLPVNSATTVATTACLGILKDTHTHIYISTNSATITSFKYFMVGEEVERERRDIEREGRDFEEETREGI